MEYPICNHCKCNILPIDKSVTIENSLPSIEYHADCLKEYTKNKAGIGTIFTIIKYKYICREQRYSKGVFGCGDAE